LLNELGLSLVAAARQLGVTMAATSGSLRRQQSVDDVLSLFETHALRARHPYDKYVEAGIDQGRHWELIGVGLVRNAGGWATVRGWRLIC